MEYTRPTVAYRSRDKQKPLQGPEQGQEIHQLDELQTTQSSQSRQL